MTQVVEVDGRRLPLSNLDKVLYPATGTTKGEVLAYYTAVAPALLPLLRGRPLTRKRWPDGVEQFSFFEKNLPNGTPEWVGRVTLPVPGSQADRETITYPLLSDLAGLVWVVNLAALELHTPQWTLSGVVSGPDRLVVDLDPGPPAGLAECARVALAVRDRLAADGLDCVPVTSGSKGLQLYAPLAGEQDGARVTGYAKAVAEELAAAAPDLVVARMTRALRPGKVFLDWSQNQPAKTTITPYSLRGRERPTAAAPRTWAEVAAGAAGEPFAQLDHTEVAARLAADGDLLAILSDDAARVGRHVPE